MTAHHDQHTEPAEVSGDDRLVGQLASGHPGPPGDPLSMLLAACRDDIRTGDQPGMPLLASAAHVPARQHRRRALLATAAATLISGGTAAVMFARDAQPGSPLWPITELVYTEHADLALIRQAIGDARAAIGQGHYTAAQAHLDEAARLLTRITPGTLAQEQLAAEIGLLRQELAVRLATPGQQGDPAGQTPGTPPGTPGPAGQTPGAPADPGSPDQRPAAPTPVGQLAVPPGQDRPQPTEQRTTTRRPRRPPR